MKGEKHRELSTKEIYRCVRGAPCQILVTARWLGKAVCPKRWSTQRINGPWMAHELHNKWHINCTGEPKETFFSYDISSLPSGHRCLGFQKYGRCKKLYSIQPILGFCDTEISGSQGIPSSYDHLGSWERLAILSCLKHLLRRLCKYAFTTAEKRTLQMATHFWCHANMW